jgi:zinc protease
LLPSTTKNVRRTVLDNGLTILVKENRAAPVAAVLAHVNIGYFNEPDRWNGLSHVIEHMFFKGTRKRPGKEQIAEEVRAIGGSINASTSYDTTTYYITVPSTNVERAIEVQADTFLGSLFDEEELAKEIEVIIQESKQKRDNPGAMLLETMYARAYDRHRIRRWRIGSDEILRSFRRDDILAFIDQTYRPENIVLSIVGDVDAGRVLDAVAREWAGMPRGELRRETSPEEPDRAEFRYHQMRGEIQQRLLEFGFHAPGLLEADAPALSIAGALLSDGRSSRLYRALKEERRLVNSVWAGYDGYGALGIFTMGAETTDDDPLACEQALFTEIDRLVTEPVNAEELQRVKTRVESRRLYGQEEVLGMARNLAAYETLGDYRLSDEMLARLQAVTGDDVQRIVEHYIRPERATLVEYLPVAAEAPERHSAEVASALGADQSLRKVPGGMGTEAGLRASASGATPQEVLLDTGARLILKRRTDLPIVALHVLFPGGKRGETRRTSGVTNLMLKSSLKGTASLSATEIAERIESLGSGIGLTLGPDYFGYSMKILADRLRDGIPILREVVAHPTFLAEEVEKEKQSIYGDIRRQQDSMFSRAMDLFNQATFGDTPYGLPANGDADAVAAIRPEDLAAWHESLVAAGGAVFAAVGDVELDEIAALLEGVVPARPQTRQETPLIERLPPQEQVVSVERQQTASVMGFPGAPLDNEDRHALDLIAEITSGLAGRFFQAVRGDNALAYAVTSFHRARRDAGSFVTYTATSPEREEMAREILLAECARLAQEPVGEEELAAAKAAIRGEQVIGTQSFGAQAGELAVARIQGLPLDASARYLARVDAVTAEEVQNVARKYLSPGQTWLGIVRGGRP